MKVNIGITPVVVVLLVFTLYRCERKRTEELMRECIKSSELVSCEKIYKGW